MVFAIMFSNGLGVRQGVFFVRTQDVPELAISIYLVGSDTALQYQRQTSCFPFPPHGRDSGESNGRAKVLLAVVVVVVVVVVVPLPRLPLQILQAKS